LTEAVRIVARVTREVQVSAGDVDDLEYHVVWCPKFRRPVRTGRSAARCEGLIRANADEHGWRIVALEIMLDQVHLLVEAHPSDGPSRIASQFKGLTSRPLRAEFCHQRSWLPALWSWPCFAATVAVSAETVRRHTGTQDERPWRKERPR
jgi:putative transposase